jgi:hypothetical protein
MKRKRDLLVTNLLSLLVLLAALLAGWWDAAAFGLAVLIVMDLLVVLRERLARPLFGSGRSAGLPAEHDQRQLNESYRPSEPSEPDVKK